MTVSPFFSDDVAGIGSAEKPVTVTLSNELVTLLSEQLYQSPIKAIEELVVNSYDADARVCKLFVPLPSELEQPTGRHLIVVFDDGHGMPYSGLVDLWQIGRSEKRNPTRSYKRAQIGKFGIGKLATYTIANRLSYITKTRTGVLTVSIDFRHFEPSSGSKLEPLNLTVKRLDSVDDLTSIASWKQAVAAAGILPADLNKATWTAVLLEELKPKASQVRSGSLQWVLSTAMPLKTDFSVVLNGNKITSSKESLEKLIEFDIKDMDSRRLEGLSKVAGTPFTVGRGGLVSKDFPKGIIGSAFVTRKTLMGKSDELMRSNGFFVRVRERLINENDALFGLQPLSHQTFNRFRADVSVDDLDSIITAPRESVETSGLKVQIELVLKAIFAEARDRFETLLEKEKIKESHKPEGERAFVPPELVEYPVADVLTTVAPDASGAEADRSWFYLSLPSGTDFRSIARGLYAEPRRKYRFLYEGTGRNQRLVKFDPSVGVFTLNSDHPFVIAHADNPRAQRVLEDFVIAEVLLEVYLSEYGIHGSTIGAVLQQRDNLLRSLPSDHPYSLQSIAAALRDSAANERDLEMALVAAARALGFVANHLSGADRADGVARFTEYPDGEKVITLEAKSSADVPSLGAIDFAGLRQHMVPLEADGCLLVAPAYPGENRGEFSQASQRAREQRVSCWTIEQLASVVEAVEAKRVTATRVLSVVLNAFSPEEVSQALSKVFGEPRWNTHKLHGAILSALRDLEGRLPNTVRNISHVAVTLASSPTFAGVDEADVERAVAEMAGASKGSLELRDRNIILLTSLDEIERRLSGLLSDPGAPRRPSQLRE